MDCEPGRLGHIDGQELDPAFHEVRDKGYGSGQTVEFGDDEDCPFFPAELKRLLKLWAISPFSTLHFDERPGKLTADPLDVAENRLTLGV